MKYDTLQGVSKFDRQTFRADSTIKNKHKTLNTYGVKNAWFARKSTKTYKQLRSEFLGFYGVICALNRGATF
jgi:hypothetical protein